MDTELKILLVKDPESGTDFLIKHLKRESRKDNSEQVDDVLQISIQIA